MFAVGDYVISGSNGICLVSDITTLDLSGIDKTRKYYILKPVYASGSPVYVPVDTASTTMRKAVSKDEALAVIKSIPEIPLIPLADEKTLERTYKEYIHQNSCEDWIKLIKTIYLRKEKRILKGCKVTAVDSKYFKQAEDYLYGEFSIALDMSKDEVRSYIEETLSHE